MAGAFLVSLVLSLLLIPVELRLLVGAFCNVRLRRLNGW